MHGALFALNLLSNILDFLTCFWMIFTFRTGSSDGNVDGSMSSGMPRMMLSSLGSFKVMISDLVRSISMKEKQCEVVKQENERK